MEKYTPPFNFLPIMLSLASAISEKPGELNLYHNLDAKPPELIPDIMSGKVFTICIIC